MAAADFILDIEQRIKGEAATELERTQRAFDSAAAAMKRFEADQMRADKALAALAPRLDEVKGKMASAMEAGDSKAFWKAAGDMEKLEEKQRSLAEKSKAAAEGFAAQAQAAETAGGALAQFAADQRAAEAATQAAAEEAKAQAEQVANLEKHTMAAARAAEQQAKALAKTQAAKAEAEARALAEQQTNLERTTKAAARAAQEQARVLQSQQSKALTESAARTKKLASESKAAAVALVAFAAIAAKAAWSAAKWVGSMVFAKKAKEIEELGTRWRKNLGDIFGGLNLDPIMAGLGKLVDFFDTSTASGRALKALFEAMFKPVAHAVGAILPKVERFLLGMVIGALKVGIAVKQMAAEFDFDLGAFDAWPDAAALGEAAAWMVATAIAAVGAAILIAAESVNTTMKIWDGLKTAWDTVVGAADKTVSRIKMIWGLLDFRSIASSLIDGFVEGIKAGISRAVGAVKEMADAAVKAAKDKLKVFSPSRVFEGIGGFVAEGFAAGVDDGAPAAQRSMADLVEPPRAPGGSGGTSGAVVTFQAGAIVINAADGTDAADQFMDRLLAALEGAGFAVGAPA
jgi:chemotaxis protein histidine kinase CheA